LKRNWIVPVVLPFLLIGLYGCPKKKPATQPAKLDVETTSVPTPTPPPQPTTDVAPQPQPPMTDRTEADLLDSGDMAVVNDELKRRGFSADIYFDYDESSLSDDSRDKLARDADLLKSRSSPSLSGARRLAWYQRVPALGERRATPSGPTLLGVAASGSAPSSTRSAASAPKTPRVAGRRTAAPIWSSPDAPCRQPHARVRLAQLA
jgi:hypothetical protein